MDGIKKKFAGYHQAMLSIVAVFNRYGIDLKPYNYEEYTTSVAIAIRPLLDAAGNLEREETSSFISLMNLHNDVIRFGEVRGIIFSDEEKTFVIDDDMREFLARQSMGL